MNNRIDRLLSKKRTKMAERHENSSLVQEQIKEEQETEDSKIEYVESQVEPLEYIYKGQTYLIPCETEEGEVMTYHDQHYQALRIRNGLPLEAKRMCDYQFDYKEAKTVEENKSLSELVVSEEEASSEYQKMKTAHEAQHPPEDDENVTT